MWTRWLTFALLFHNIHFRWFSCLVRYQIKAPFEKISEAKTTVKRTIKI